MANQTTTETTSKMTVAEFAAALPAPEGFSKKVDEYEGESWEKNPAYAADPDEPTHCMVPVMRPRVTFLSPDGIEIRVEFYEDDEGWSANGHTSFSTSQGTRTFDRRGVEDSFYLYSKPALGAEDVSIVDRAAATIAEQVARVAESRARIAESTPVPGLTRFLVTPEKRAEISAKLRAGKSHTFAPAGFGTAIELTTRSPGRRYGTTKASPATAAFFGVPALYQTMHDHD